MIMKHIKGCFTIIYSEYQRAWVFLFSQEVDQMMLSLPQFETILKI